MTSTLSSRDDVLGALLAHRDEFLAFLRKRGHGAFAEDILQSAYLRVLERGVSLRDDEKAIGWFYAVLRHAAIDYIRAAGRRQRLHDKAMLESTSAVGTSNDDPCLENTLALIGSLEPASREALETVYVRGKSIDDLATTSRISRNAATVRVHRARRALAHLVAEAAWVKSCGVRRTAHVVRPLRWSIARAAA